MTLHCGTARVDVTPPAEMLSSGRICTIGFWYERALPLITVRDPLSARVIYLSDGDTHVALISWESLGDAVGMRERVRRILDAYGFHNIGLFFASTHSHTVPDTLDLCGQPQPEEYLDWVANQITEGIIFARRQAAPVSSLSCSTGRIEDLAINRRPLLKSGKVAVLESHPDPNDIADPGVMDNRITSLRLFDSHHHLLARIVHFACHAVHMQAVPEISPGYPGLLSHLFESEGGCVTLFLNGACGDVNPARMDDWEYAKTFAQALHAESKRAETANPHVIQDSDLRLMESTFMARRRIVEVPPEEEVQSALAASSNRTDAEWRHGGEGWKLYLNQQMRRAAAMPQTLETSLTVLRLGPVVFAGVAGEIFAREGLALRESHPSLTVLPVSYVNGYRGYLAPKSAYEHEGYEVQCAPWSPLEMGETEKIIEKLNQQIDSTGNEQE